MKYKQLQALAKALRNQGLIAKNFKLTQKANILKAEIERVTGQITGTTTPAPQNEEMTQDDFNHKFTQGYVALVHEEETIGCGVVTTRTPDVQRKLFNLYGISATTFYAMYKKVPTLFEIPENGNMLCRIATKQQADGTYKPEH